MDKVFVYVLKSLKSGKAYTGMSKDVNRRLKLHNAGKSKFTSGHKPWVLFYVEEHKDFKSARKREKYLKSAAGKKWLKKNHPGNRGSLPD